jgi:hypothetical protein
MKQRRKKKEAASGRKRSTTRRNEPNTCTRKCQHLKETNQAIEHMMETRTLTVSTTSSTE